MKTKILLLCWLMFGIQATATAEIIQGIQYFDTLGEIKQKYPNANFVATKPAWLQPDQAFYTVSGTGMSGILRIAFDDTRPAFMKMLVTGQDLPGFADGTFKRLSEQPDNTALSVAWVRWSPEKPIPLDRYKQRYGAPTCKFDESMSPICLWPAHNLEAQMTEDQKYVLFVTTGFTKAEQRASYQRKFNFVPDWLK